LRTSHGALTLTLTATGRHKLAQGAQGTKLTLKVTQPGTGAVTKRGALRLMP
jgi:hypothetical protein